MHRHFRNLSFSCELCIGVKPAVTDSPPLLLSGQSPTPWRSSPAPSPQCSHYLEDRQTDSARISRFPSAFLRWLKCKNLISTAHRCDSSIHDNFVSNRYQHGLALHEYWFKHEPLLVTLPLWFNKWHHWLQNANWSCLKDCVLGVICKEKLYMENCFFEILRDFEGDSL